MPVSALLVDSDIKVKRSPSLRSEHSSVSESRQVRFNQDVSVKRIPKKVTKTKSLPLDPQDEFSGKCSQFVNIPPPSDQQQIADEAETILKHLEDIQCSVSNTPRVQSPTRQVTSPTPGPASRQTTPLQSRNNTLEKKNSGSRLFGLAQRFSRSSSDLDRGGSSLDRIKAMRVEGYSEQEDSPGLSHDQDRFYGLQALSNLDNAVNGSKLNNLYRNQHQSDYSVPVKKNNITPPKPPRKAPSASPPSIRRGYLSHDELDFKSRRSEMFETLDKEMESGVGGPGGPYSYTDKNPNLNHLRNSPTRAVNSRQSPGRNGGNHTDSEILSSPTQVLYATISADKHKHPGNLNNHYMANSASQTIHSGFRPISADRHIPSRTVSKENILDDPPYRHGNNGGGSSNKHGSRSLERFVDDDKENLRRRQEMKARIHVSSPIRMKEAESTRKPYRTTINTATDTIQYNGFSHDNLRRHVDNEHYKVPRNKAPVPAEFITRNGIRMESDNSSSAYNGKYKNSKSQFNSASLVRNAERRGGGSNGGGTRTGARGEFDREGRRIHSDRRVSGERNRAYSGYSTSPDREMSPDRYAKPRGGGGGQMGQGHRQHGTVLRRSPSTSPTRPPRTKSSPSREIHIPVRREHSGRVVERTPSTRASATSRSPIKKIQRVHNEITDRDPSPSKSRTLTLTRNKGDKTGASGAGARATKTILMNKIHNKPVVEDDRLSRFTEYRGASEEPRGVLTNGRRSSTGFDLRKTSNSSGEGQYDRERGQSVPPGANIESMKDFYKTTQYRSMYHLPPSPSRPAPVLDRNQTMQRERSSEGGFMISAPPRRHAKTSISEGEMTDDQARQDRVIRQRNKFLNNIIPRNGPGQAQDSHHSNNGTLNRRVVSGDRERNNIYGELNNRRVGSHERPVRRQAPQPPTQKVRRSSVDVLETSHSESESPRPDQLRLFSDEEYELDSSPSTAMTSNTATRHRITVTHHGGPPSVHHHSILRDRDRDSSVSRASHVLYLDSFDAQHHPRYQSKLNGGAGLVPGHSDIDSDYRRDMITNSVHMEARTRDGGHGGSMAPPSIYQQAATLNRDKSVSKSKLDNIIRGRSMERVAATREVEISQDDDEDEVVRAPGSTTLSREEERRKIIELERRAEKGRPVSVSRSSSRVSKLMPGVRTKNKFMGATETENESQYSGHSSSSVKRDVGLKSRYNSNNISGVGGRVKRSGSTATTSSARQVISRKKMPGSVTSSINSSESENGQSAISRATNQSNLSNRSVYLHATAVADIPSAKPTSNGAGAIGENKQLGGSSNLQKSKKISRSISLLAPFKKQQQQSASGRGAAAAAGVEKEVIYDNNGQIVHSGKPPRAPPAPIRKIMPGDSHTMSREKKFASSSDLLADEGEVMSSPEDPTNSKTQSKVSRSVSMPKDTRLAGWFKKRKRV